MTGTKPTEQLLFQEHLVVVRGGGSLATGVAWRLCRSGFPVVICELERPLTVRRTIAFSSAVLNDSITVEGVAARLVRSRDEKRVVAAALTGDAAVIVSQALPSFLSPAIVVDARAARRNIDTTIADAPLVIGIGPGFTAGLDCHAVVEAKRGSHLGRVFWSGGAQPDPGTSDVGGRRSERILHAPRAGAAAWARHIGDAVAVGDLLGEVGGIGVRAPFSGVIRGLIADGTEVAKGLEIADINPGRDTPCDEISDRALAVGGGVLEATLTWLNRPPTTQP